ncbi:MAG: NUDIX hydrolase [Anaerolineae bacterium]|nr:NUDIX hydrolase [Anaerolineae bacterium]
MNENKIIAWAQALAGVAQCGLTYNRTNAFEVERYSEIQRIASDMMAEVSNVRFEDMLELFDEQSHDGYATPKVDVRGAVFRDDAVLLVKEHVTGKWTLPGGWVDVGDTPSGAVEREVWEESGYRAKASKVILVADRNLHYPPGRFHIYKLFFLCDLTGGEALVSHETDGVGFFREDDLPELDLNRTSSGHLAACFAHYRSPALPTEFD